MCLSSCSHPPCHPLWGRGRKRGKERGRGRGRYGRRVGGPALHSSSHPSYNHTFPPYLPPSLPPSPPFLFSLSSLLTHLLYKLLWVVCLIFTIPWICVGPSTFYPFLLIKPDHYSSSHAIWRTYHYAVILKKAPHKFIGVMKYKYTVWKWNELFSKPPRPTRRYINECQKA